MLLRRSIELKKTKVDLIIEDDRTSPRETVLAFHRLVGKKIDAIIGPTWVHVTQAITPLLPRAKVVAISTSSFPETLDFDRSKGYLFATSYSLRQDVKTFEHYVATRGVKKVAFITNSSTWGLHQLRSYKQVAKKLALEIVAEYSASKIEQNDWRAVLPSIQSREPDVLVLFLGKDDIEVIARRAREIQMKTPIFSSNHTYDTWKKARSRGTLEDVCFTYPYLQLQRNQGFLQKFEERFSVPAQLYADTSYDALLLLYAALVKSRESGRELPEVLRSQSFVGSVGTYRYSANESLSIGETSLVCVKDDLLRAEHTAG